MAIQSDETLVTKGDLKTLYTDKILPYLGGNISLSTNISDSYSTDEKIVGIWLDGKPLYQKTFIGNIGTPRYNYFINHNISNAEWKNLFGGFTDSNASSFQPFQYNWINNTGGQGGSPTTSYASANVGLSSTQINIRIVTGEIENCTKYIVTLQYTKSTDTTSTALTTPGCYDISRPDLWPTGKEIFFGNGLYGYRKIGTITAAIDARVWTDIVTLPAGVLPSIIQSGGWIKWGDEGQHDYKYPVNTAMTDLTGWGSTLGAWSVVRTANSQIALWNTCGLTRTDAPYDVWCTYTKN